MGMTPPKVPGGSFGGISLRFQAPGGVPLGRSLPPESSLWAVRGEDGPFKTVQNIGLYGLIEADDFKHRLASTTKNSLAGTPDPINVTYSDINKT